MWEAVWNNTVVAEARHLTLLSGREFFPSASVRWDLLRRSGHRPELGGLGPETTFDIVVNDRVAQRGAWCYANPARDLLNIKNLVTFGHEIRVRSVRRPAPINRFARLRARRRANVGGP